MLPDGILRRTEPSWVQNQADAFLFLCITTNKEKENAIETSRREGTRYVKTEIFFVVFQPSGNRSFISSFLYPHRVPGPKRGHFWNSSDSKYSLMFGRFSNRCKKSSTTGKSLKHSGSRNSCQSRASYHRKSTYVNCKNIPELRH